MNSHRIIFIVGPTAVGKTAVACELAQKISGEIISCDSMQVYKEVTIVSNKPPREILRRIPHHLIDVVSVAAEFDVARFRKKALSVIKTVQAKGKIPIVAGGSGMYMAVLLDGIFKDAPKDLSLRKDLQAQAREKGSEYLYGKLLKVDPPAAQKIHPNDERRIIRALEVFMLSQKPISLLQKKRSGLWEKCDVEVLALNRPREELYELINKRVEAMFAAGIVEEIQKLLKLPLSQTARSIIGIKEIQGFLMGEYDLEHAKYLMKLNTRHYAKRQLTWFRRDQRLKWIMVHRQDTVEDVVLRMMDEITNFNTPMVR